MMKTTSVASDAPGLKRSLTLWDPILYGVVVIQPVAPMSVFGVLNGVLNKDKQSKGDNTCVSGRLLRRSPLDKSRVRAVT